MAKEYIEREKALNDDRWNSVILSHDRERAREIILCQPAADVVEVVRCRECALWHPCSSGKAGICRGKMIGVSKPDDFCSYGERRDNNAAD